ncbi:glycoside hydrolase family 76 protein [Streptomyces silvisoli]|uniref:Glycoside hydrolase family 76 protein n=1 Tax=Streptomyces silvisoli TaxID=3034235 RepID=A0ABT5ZL17_9ACTN|nr:glycoside hydrolase family 76 protein [Streptomyces silvisoli]MDF3290524.1 glycoside hydrolase family 76 protein [Streptomyces silvisoli]
MSAAARAAASYQALQKYLAVGDGSGLYHERYPVVSGDNAYSYEWPFSQAHTATLDLTGMPGQQGEGYLPDLAARAVGQQRYWKASGGTTGKPGYASYPVPPYGGGGDFFYDDNEWVGLLDVQRYLMHGDREALARAEQIFQLVVSGWDSDTAHADPGGVFWTQATWSQDRNTVSNMPGAELGLRLHQITGQATYLDWARRMYDWTNRYLLSPDALYWDHVNLTGTVETTFWTYNQGVPVGVNTLLYQITGDREYLDRAQRIAGAAHSYFVTGGRLLGQPPYFNSIYFKNLLLLESVAGGHAYRDAMAEYGDTVWNRFRDSSTGLFRFEGSAQTETLQQAAMVQIYAVLAWPPADHRHLY